jgi:hypothetical protein
VRRCITLLMQQHMVHALLKTTYEVQRTVIMHGILLLHDTPTTSRQHALRAIWLGARANRVQRVLQRNTSSSCLLGVMLSCKHHPGTAPGSAGRHRARCL